MKKTEKKTEKNIKEKTEKKFDSVWNYIIYFMLYCMIGWIYEVALEFFVWHHGFVNRGTFFGPWLPVYGFGALIFLFCIYPLIKGKPLKQRLILIPVVFLGCTFAATALELMTSYLCEWTIGYIPWTYEEYKITFQNRISLIPSIRFGIGGVVFLYLVQPLFEKICQKLGNKTKIVAYIIIAVLIIDGIYSFIIK